VSQKSVAFLIFNNLKKPKLITIVYLHTESW